MKKRNKIAASFGVAAIVIWVYLVVVGFEFPDWVACVIC